MGEPLKSFFENSAIAKKIKLKSRIIIQRTSLSPREVLAIREKQKYGPIPKQEKLCELEVGSQILARGKIVRKKGEYYFKVLEKIGKGGAV